MSLVGVADNIVSRSLFYDIIIRETYPSSFYRYMNHLDPRIL